MGATHLSEVVSTLAYEDSADTAAAAATADSEVFYPLPFHRTEYGLVGSAGERSAFPSDHNLEAIHVCR
jgi:hypothetical protein